MCALNDKPGNPHRIDRNLARSRALTFTFSTQYALTKELKPLKCIMPYMNVVHQTAQPHAGAHQDSKRQLMGLGAAHHREQGCSLRCGCAFHMHACRSATTTSVRHFHAEQVGTKLDSRLHDCTRSATSGCGAKRMVEFTGAMWWWLLWRISRLLTTLSMLSWSIHCINSHNSSQKLHDYHLLTESWNGPRTG